MIHRRITSLSHIARLERPREARTPRRLPLVLGLAFALLTTANAAPAQSPPKLPFAPGEELTYEIRSSRFGNIGQAKMLVGQPDTIRDRSTWVLHFDFRTKITFFTVEDRTRSWIDPLRMASLRYHKHERHPLSTTVEEVEIHPEEDRWVAADGRKGRSPTRAPLDELSFIYFLRTLPLDSTKAQEFERHFDPARNPVVVHVRGRELLQAPVGDFKTVVVEMQVNDSGRFGGKGTLRFYLTDDDQRLPIRIETSVPIAGDLTLDLIQATFASTP